MFRRLRSCVALLKRPAMINAIMEVQDSHAHLITTFAEELARIQGSLRVAGQGIGANSEAIKLLNLMLEKTKEDRADIRECIDLVEERINSSINRLHDNLQDNIDRTQRNLEIDIDDIKGQLQ